MIFKILKIRNTVKELKENPGKFAGGEAGNMFFGFFVFPLIIFSTILIGLYLVGFTDTFKSIDIFLFGLPAFFSRILFWVFLIPFTIFVFILFKLRRIIKNSVSKKVDQTIKVESKVVE